MGPEFTMFMPYGIAVVVLLVVGGLLIRFVRFQRFRRLEAEHETDRGARLLKAYFDDSPDALFALNIEPDGRLTYERYNRACRVLTGIADDSAIGKEPQAVFGSEPGEKLEQHYRACLQSGQPYSYQETQTLLNGQRDWHASASPHS